MYPHHIHMPAHGGWIGIGRQGGGRLAEPVGHGEARLMDCRDRETEQADQVEIIEAAMVQHVDQSRAIDIVPQGNLGRGK